MTTNEELALQLSSPQCSITPVTLLSSPSGVRSPTAPCGRVLTFCYEGLEIYNVEACIQVISEARILRPQLRLTIVLYGRHTTQRADLAKRIRDLGHEWIELLEDLSADAVNDLLNCHDLLLRLTTQDGDSQAVREALRAGLRVLATDAAPRPAGVEVVPVGSTAGAVAAQLLEPDWRLASDRRDPVPLMEHLAANLTRPEPSILVATALPLDGPVLEATLGEQLKSLAIGPDRVSAVGPTMNGLPTWATHVFRQSHGPAWYVSARVAARAIRIVRRERHDTVYARDDWTAAALSLLKWALPTSTALIVDKRGLAEAEISVGGRARWKQLVIRLVERLSIKLADRLLFVSSNLQMALCAEGRAAVIVPNCVGEARPTRPASQLEPPLVVYVGGGDAWQSVDETLRLLVALGHHGLSTLVVTKDEGLATRASLMGVSVASMTRSEVHALLSTAAASLVLRANSPATRVASPIKLGESIGWGCRVIGSASTWERFSELEELDMAYSLTELDPDPAGVRRLVEWITGARPTTAALDAAAALLSWGTYKAELEWFFLGQRSEP